MLLDKIENMCIIDTSSSKAQTKTQSPIKENGSQASHHLSETDRKSIVSKNCFTVTSFNTHSDFSSV